MELKYQNSIINTEDITSFNRTFMELKLSISLEIKITRQVLIVPLWN